MPQMKMGIRANTAAAATIIAARHFRGKGALRFKAEAPRASTLTVTLRDWVALVGVIFKFRTIPLAPRFEEVNSEEPKLRRAKAKLPCQAVTDALESGFWPGRSSDESDGGPESF